MITLYTANTQNGIKIPIALEELGLPYEMLRLDLGLSLIHISESGAILWYLGETYPGLLPVAPDQRLRALQWLNFQVAAVGPMYGQAGFFLRSAPQRIDFAIERYVGEARRLASVLEGRLAEAEWLAGEAFSIADIAHFGWLSQPDYADVDLSWYPRLRDWVASIAERPAVIRARKRMQTTPVGWRRKVAV